MWYNLGIPERDRGIRKETKRMVRTGTYLCSQYVKPFRFTGLDGKEQEAGNYYIVYVMFDDEDFLFRFYMKPSEYEQEIGFKFSGKPVRFSPFMCDFTIDSTGKKLKCGLANFEFQK